MNEMLKSKRINHQPLESLVGSLHHVTNIILMSQCFLSELEYLKLITDIRGFGHLSQMAKLDLTFWLSLLDCAQRGINII